MTEKIYETPCGNIHYYVNSRGENTRLQLVFLPGLTADHRLFDKQIEYFEGKFPVFVWDAPGHAASFPFRFDFCLADKACWLWEILTKEGFDAPVIVGQSMGGYVGQAFSQLYPDKLKGFVSIDSAPLQREYVTGVEIWLLKRMEPVYLHYPWKALLKSGTEGVAVSEYGRKLMLDMMMVYDGEQDRYAKLAGHGFKMLAEAMEADLPYKISCPALLICGKKDHAGSCIRYNKAWHKKTGIPIKWLDNAGHNSNTDKPREVNRLIEELVGKIESIDYENYVPVLCNLPEDMFALKINIKVIIALTIAALIIFSIAVKYGLVMTLFSLKHEDFFLYPKICSHMNFEKQRLDGIDASEDDKIIIKISERWLLSYEYMSNKEIFDRMLSIYDELSSYKNDVNVICTDSNGAPKFSLTKNFFQISDYVKYEIGDPEFTADYIMKNILEHDNIYYADLGFSSFSDSDSYHRENNSLRFIRGWLKCGEKADLTHLHSLEALDVIIFDDGDFSPHDISGIENLKALVFEISNDKICLDFDTFERYNNIKDVYILSNNISEADLDRIGAFFPDASIYTMDYNERAQSECFDKISKKYFISHGNIE